MNYILGTLKKNKQQQQQKKNKKLTVKNLA